MTELGAGGRPVDAIWSRSPVHGARGMAATAHPLASQVALDILKQGGSAVDAAIAANAALGLMEPTGNGIGGDLFALVWDPDTGTLYGYNGSGRSPRGQSLAQLALCWNLGFDPVASVLIGASRPEQIIENAEALDAPPLSAEEQERIAKALTC